MNFKSLLLSILLIVPFGLNAQTIENGVLTNCTGLSGEYTIPDGVKEIGEGAFFYSGVTKVHVPASVEVIGKSAFYMAYSLQSVDFAAGSKLKTVRDLAFSECTQLQQIELPASVDSLGANAFTFCDGLRKVTLPASLKRLCYGTFSSCVALTRIVVPPACKVIDEFAFGNCTGLSYADVQGADTISTKAFYHCSVLSTLKLPETLKAIGDSAFMRCEALATLTLPASLERAGDKMFLRCPYFEGFTVAQGNAHFVAENGVLYSKDKTVLYECPQLYTADVFTVPATVKTIRPKAFFECNAVKGISLPATIEGIGLGALSNNGIAAFDFAGNDMYPVHDGMIYARLKSLDGLALLAAPCQSPKTDVVLLPGTVYIADYALAYSQNLNNVTMPENLKYVGPYAFYNDQALQNVTCYAVEAPQLLDNAFGDVPFNKVYLHIKPGSYNSYQAAGWLFLMGDDITGDYPYVDPATGLNAIAATGDAIVVSRCGDCLVVTAAQPIATVAVYDIAGRLVGAASAHGQNTATVQAVDNAGVHVMRVVFTSGKRATVKF